MLIAQITDLHIGFDRTGSDDRNLRRLRKVLARLAEGPDRPDMLLMTGDLTEFGDAESFARLADAVADCPFPVHAMVGNHDTRAGLLAALPQTPTDDGFIHYALDGGDLRVLVLDTLEEGRHGGAFCERRAAWLAGQLSAFPETPTLIAMHHPPAALGIDWLDPGEDEPWIERFTATVARHGQIRAIISGHLHRTIHSRWKAASLTVCGSTAPLVALDLRAVDPEQPDGRAMITDAPPCYALHRWNGERIASHIEPVADDTRVLARYDAAMQQAVTDMMGERFRS